MEIALAPLGQLFLGLTLAATAGLRAWLPLLAIGILGYSNVIPLNEQLAWLGSPNAIAILATATLLEIAADKIPALDNFMDAFGLAIRPIAGAVAMSSTLTFLDPAVGLAIGIAAGGTTAEVVELGKATTRLVTNAASLGMGGPVLSVAEDGLALGGIVLGFLMPYLVGFMVVVLLVVGLLTLPKLVRAFRRRRRREVQGV